MRQPLPQIADGAAKHGSLSGYSYSFCHEGCSRFNVPICSRSTIRSTSTLTDLPPVLKGKLIQGINVVGILHPGRPIRPTRRKMRWPENTTSLSLPGVFKWILLIISIPLLIKAFQGIVLRSTQTGFAGRFGSVGDALRGKEAVLEGLEAFGYAAICIIGAWALWFFWQQHED